MQIDENTIISDILDHREDCAEVFRSMGLSCLGCPAARMETIAEACEIHGISSDELLGKLRRQLAAK